LRLSLNKGLKMVLHQDNKKIPDKKCLPMRFSIVSVASQGVHNLGETVHLFWSMPSTDSYACRPLILEQTVHFFMKAGI
ncbi:MAG: hypothetical protein SVP52_07830, partial [Chloroflexota bacterium]|nr:hypothetical protein [Chloroflexota bacterium]